MAKRILLPALLMSLCYITNAQSSTEKYFSVSGHYFVNPSFDIVGSYHFGKHEIYAGYFSYSKFGMGLIPGATAGYKYYFKPVRPVKFYISADLYYAAGMWPNPDGFPYVTPERRFMAIIAPGVNVTLFNGFFLDGSIGAGYGIYHYASTDDNYDPHYYGVQYLLKVGIGYNFIKRK